MSCNYRIRKPVHIGQRVRKTSDNNTVEFANEPMIGMKIESYNKMGFRISHPEMPKVIWVDFRQLPLQELHIKSGIIQDEITFVEGIVGDSFMYLTRCDTDDYRELESDKELKDKLKFYSPDELTPGERVMSSLCTDGTEMIFLGTVYEKEMSSDYTHHSSGYNGYGTRSNYKSWYEYHFYFEDKNPKRALFLTHNKEGKYSFSSYPVTNKAIKDCLKMSDFRDDDIFHKEYSDLTKNIEMAMAQHRIEYTKRINDKSYGSSYKGYPVVNSVICNHKGFDNIKMKGWIHSPSFLSIEKESNDFYEEMAKEQYDWNGCELLKENPKRSRY